MLLKHLISTFVTLLTIQTVHGVTVTRTIDNTGDLTTGTRVLYEPPSGQWNDERCTICWIHPSPQKAFMGTWNEATYDPGEGPLRIRLQFEGVCLLSDPVRFYD